MNEDTSPTLCKCLIMRELLSETSSRQVTSCHHDPHPAIHAMYQTSSNARGYYKVAFLGALIASYAVSVHGLPATTTDGLDTLPNAGLDLSTQQDITVPPALAKFPAGPLNRFLKIVSSLPAALDAVGLVLTPLQQSLADAAGVDTTRDDLKWNAPCADVTAVFAWGTTEPGNIGLVTGPPFIDALSEQLGSKSLAVQGVEYPATFRGFNLNGTEGVASM